MKIAFLTSSIGLYGAEKVVLSLAARLQASGCQITLINLSNPAQKNNEIIQEAERLGIKTKLLPCYGRFDFKAIKELSKYIEEVKFDVIHSQGYKSNFYALLSSHSKKVKLVSTCHNWTSNSFKMKIYEFLDKQILRRFDKVVAVSGQIYQRLKKSGITEDKLKIIYNGIAIPKQKNNLTDLRKEYNVSADKRCVGTIGRLSKEKGQGFLLRAIKKLIEQKYNLALFIIGEGDLKNKLQKEAIALGINDRVYFTGYRSDIGNVLTSLDIFVLPSLKEGTPIVLLEAMLAKKIIVASNVGAIPQILEKNGFLCMPGDEDSLSESIRKALLLSKIEAETMGNYAHSFILEKYSQGQMVHKYEKVYQDLLV